MNTEVIDPNNIEDLSSIDEFQKEPGSPRFIFFDDERPDKMELVARNEAIDIEQEESLKRPHKTPYKHQAVRYRRVLVKPSKEKQKGKKGEFPTIKQYKMEPYAHIQTEWKGEDYIDPELERHERRMEHLRYLNWLYGPEGTVEEKRQGSRPPKLSQRKIGGWSGRNVPDKREKLMASIVSTELNHDSFISKIKEGMKSQLGWSNQQTDVLWEKLSVYKAIREILKKPEKGQKGLTEWKQIHQFLDGHGDISFIARPPQRTIFSNPDGTKIINSIQGQRGPINAKMAFSRAHKIPEERVMVERVHVEKWNPEFLKKNQMPNPGKSVYVVCARKLSNETPSNYYDPNPSFSEKISREGKWETTYQWQAGTLHAVPESKVIPPESYRLTVRDLEQALLQGASFADEDHDDVINYFEGIDNSDARHQNVETPTRDVSMMDEDEQIMWGAAMAIQAFELTEILEIDLDRVTPSQAEDGFTSYEIRCFVSDALWKLLPKINDVMDTWELVQVLLKTNRDVSNLDGVQKTFLSAAMAIQDEYLIELVEAEIKLAKPWDTYKGVKKYQLRNFIGKEIWNRLPRLEEVIDTKHLMWVLLNISIENPDSGGWSSAEESLRDSGK